MAIGFTKILALITAVALGCAKESKGEHNHAKSGNKPSLSAAATPSPKNTNGPILQNNPNNEQAANSQNTVRMVLPPKDLYDWIAWGGNIALVFAGFGGIWVALRSVHAAEQAARAALLGAQAVINAERAVLLFKVVKEGEVSHLFGEEYDIRVLNHGKVPAKKIRFSKPVLAVTTLKDFLSRAPKYNDAFEVREWLAPQESCTAATFFSTDCTTSRFEVAAKAKVPVMNVEIIIYGQVVYLDGISDVVRHSRYCFAFESGGIRWSDERSLSPVASEVYSECT